MGDDMELSKIYPGNLVMMFLLLKKISISERFLSSSLKIAMISYRWSLLFPLSCKILVDFLLCVVNFSYGNANILIALTRCFYERLMLLAIFVAKLICINVESDVVFPVIKSCKNFGEGKNDRSPQ
jgi:hypothetical protein